MTTVRPRRVLVLTADRVGPVMAGPAIRAVELARVLAADGHDVTLATAWAPDDGHDAGVEVVHLWGDDLRPLAADVDVVVAMTGVLHDHPWLADLRAAAGRGGRLHVVADAYDPVLFEVLAGFTATPEPERSERIADASRRMCGALRWADLVLCATSAQRHLLLGVLAAYGRIGAPAWDADPTLASSVALVPFGLPSTPPSAADRAVHPLRAPNGPHDADDLVVLWGGGLWDWLDPLTLVRAVATLRDGVGGRRVAVHFLAGAHPTPSVPAPDLVAATRSLAAAEGIDEAGTGQVTFAASWVPYGERAQWLTDADVGASLAPDHAESTFANRTRVLDYLWAGLPVLHSTPPGDPDDLAALIVDNDLGVVVPPGDVEASVAALARLADPGWYARASSRVGAVAATLTWPTVAGPLRDFCTEPRSALSEPPQPPSVATLRDRRSVGDLAAAVGRRLRSSGSARAAAAIEGDRGASA